MSLAAARGTHLKFMVCMSGKCFLAKSRRKGTQSMMAISAAPLCLQHSAARMPTATARRLEIKGELAAKADPASAAST